MCVLYPGQGHSVPRACHGNGPRQLYALNADPLHDTIHKQSHTHSLTPCGKLPIGNSPCVLRTQGDIL